MAGDFVGNTAEDIIASDDQGQWHLLQSTGSTFNADVSTRVVWSKITGGAYTDIQRGDFNGDGKDDVVALLNPSTQVSPGTEVHVLLTTGGTFSDNNFTKPIAKTMYMGFSMETGINRILVGTFDSDCRDDVVAWNQYANNMQNGGQNKVYVGKSISTAFDWGNPNPPQEDPEWGYADVSNMYSWVEGNFSGDWKYSATYQKRFPVHDFVWFSTAPAGYRTYYGLISNQSTGFNPNNGKNPYLLGQVYNGATAWPFSNDNALVQIQRRAPRTVNPGILTDNVWTAATNGTFWWLGASATTNPNGDPTFSLATVQWWFNYSDYPNTYRVFMLVGKRLN